MKHLAFAALAVLLFTSPALAQEPPQQSGPVAPQDSQFHQRFEQTHAQMKQIHDGARTQMLGALSPEHRQLLATIAGQLAVADTPDFDAAAKQLDAALSATEKQAILAAAKTEWTKSTALMQTVMPPSPDGQHPMMRSGAMRINDKEPMTAGTTLLRTAMGSGGMNIQVSTMGMYH